MQNPSIILYLVVAIVSVGGVLITIGVLKSKIHQNTEQAKNHVSKDELAAAIRRSDEMLALMKERAEEDRTKSQGQYREFYGLLTGYENRISALETQHTGLAKSIDELKVDVKSGFSDLRTELKELQKEIQEIARKQC
jgi:chromosome segregation ATPase